MATLKQRGKVYYSDLYYPGHPDADKTGRLQKPLDTDKLEAYRQLKELVDQRDAARFNRAPKDLSLKAFLPEFFEWSSTKNHSTHSHHKRAVKMLLSVFPVTHLSQISPGILEQAYTKWKLAGKKLYARNRALSSLKMMMRKAEARGYVAKADWVNIRKDKEPQGRLLWYSMEELRGLLEVCHGYWKTATLLGARAGLRPSEIYYLQWEGGVDLERRRIHIAPIQEDGELVFRPKDHERRWVPMPDDLYDHLADSSRIGKWVIEDKDGRPTLYSFLAYYRRLTKKAGLKGSMYTLRHTYGSDLASRGANAKMIQIAMGHAKLEQSSRYMHLSPDAQQGIAKLQSPIPTGNKTGDSLDEKKLPG